MLSSVNNLYSPENEHDSCGIGFVANIKGIKTNDIVNRGLEVLVNMTHRGAAGADNKTGDGAGMLLQIPDSYFRSQFDYLPSAGQYGTGLVFLPQDEKDRSFCQSQLENIINEESLELISWRDVPTDNQHIGDIAKAAEPVVKQVFVKLKDKSNQNDLLGIINKYDKKLELKLYIVRKRIEQEILKSSLLQKKSFHIPSLSCRTFCYKGMLEPDQLKKYFFDLQQPQLKSAIALVHSRFSTNTFPAWGLAQPFRMIAHNGEINTIKGNRFWMQARESQFASKLFGEDIKKILPVIEPFKSDSASFDNALEMLVATGRSLPHALTMLIPESWNEKNPIPEELKSFYEYHSTFMEPWDGPASIVFTDGRFIGGTLDRNGLRPSRFVVTKDDLIVMGSEIGVQTFPAANIKEKGRLRPGKILLVDTEKGCIIPDKEIKDDLSKRQPYKAWLNENRANLSDVVAKREASPEIPIKQLRKYQTIFGYNKEDLLSIIAPMVKNAQEPTASMGADTPVAVLSNQPQRLFNYFKQLFAQVTNPPIDPIREELVMSLTSYIGSQHNLLEETPDHCKMLKFKTPIFTNNDLAKIKDMNMKSFQVKALPMLFDIENIDSNNTEHFIFQAGNKLEIALDKLCEQAEKLTDNGCNLLILSDREANSKRIPIPSLLACAAVHHHLIRKKKRTKVGLIIETGEARDVMHFALLFGYGAGAVNPYVALASINNLIKDNLLEQLNYQEAEANYIKAIRKGLLKILSKMGISTLRSYRGAQIFEAIGLEKDFVDKYFTNTNSLIEGIGLQEIALEAILSHNKANKLSGKTTSMCSLPSEGIYTYRKNKEHHAWNPETIGLLQWATRANNKEKYKEFSSLCNQQNQVPNVLRGFFDFKSTSAIDIKKVESASEIMKRFVTGAMSFGSISKEAHEAMAMALNEIGGKSNTGEGGEDPRRFEPFSDGTSARSAIKQIASGRFGVTNYYLVNADEIQIKMVQGAKPGEGGQLPGHKVNEIIAKTRHSTPGVTLISPPPHHDIYSIEDLAQLIFDLKNVNPDARISVKLGSEVGVGTIAAGVAKAHADMILISGYDGGTGASPLSSIKHAGLPWELGLAETQQTLVLNKLRSRVRLQTDGQMKTGRDVVIAAILGAEEFGFSTAALIVLGCVMMRKCHLNTCPVGIATQDPVLRKKFRGKYKYLVNYFNFIAEEIREILASIGVAKLDDIVGRTDFLKVNFEKKSFKKNNNSLPILNNLNLAKQKSSKVDLSKLIVANPTAKNSPLYCMESQDHKIDKVLDLKLIEKAFSSLKNNKKVDASFEIKNTDRTIGAMLSGAISKQYGINSLPDNAIEYVFKGSAGQSFGAFLVKGVTFRLQGDANDYLGKGLSGGRIIVTPPDGSTFIPEENIIIGNTVLYGATSGEAYINGVTGERFAVRNSGVKAVIEGAGDHCCEYMTGGVVVVLGKTGRNFAAGMSGGIAFVLDLDGDFDYFCNKSMVELTLVSDATDRDFLKQLVEKHHSYTSSSLAEKILADWDFYLSKFIKVMPLEYKRILEGTVAK